MCVYEVISLFLHDVEQAFDLTCIFSKFSSICFYTLYSIHVTDNLFISLSDPTLFVMTADLTDAHDWTASLILFIFYEIINWEILPGYYLEFLFQVDSFSSSFSLWARQTLVHLAEIVMGFENHKKHNFDINLNNGRCSHLWLLVKLEAGWMVLPYLSIGINIVHCLHIKQKKLWSRGASVFSYLRHAYHKLSQEMELVTWIQILDEAVCISR